MPFEVGQTLGGYELIEVLSTSGTGITYKVRNPLAQRLEVLKILPRDLQADQERVDRFLREVKIHARLLHPKIATFYNALKIDGELVMTSEFVEGLPLDQVLEQGALPLAQAVDYALQALSALEFAHQQSVIHRNISSSSLVIAPDGALKIQDFALAKAVTDPRLTHTGLVMGAMHYISPEQVQGLSNLDARTDLYSLSVVLYEMIAGRKPFDSKSQFEVMQAHVELPPPVMRDFPAEVPAELEDAVLKGLAKLPENRFASAAEFKAALEAVKPALGEVPRTENLASSEEPSSQAGRVASISVEGQAPLPPSLAEAASRTGDGSPNQPGSAAPSSPPENAQKRLEAPPSRTEPLEPEPAQGRSLFAAEPPGKRPSRSLPAKVPPEESSQVASPALVGLLTFIIVSLTFFLALMIVDA